MAVDIGQMAEFIVDTGTPRHLQENIEQLFIDDEADDTEEEAEQSIAEKSIADKFWKLLQKPARKTRGISLGALQRTRVTVIAPGAGVGANGAVYMELKQDPSLRLRIEGRSGMPYDRYPTAWAQVGAPAPNLESFAQGMLSQGVIQDTDCFICGSRGGQVVLPTLWKHLGDSVPPAIVINGGCAINMPIKVNWPATAVTFLLLGGCDYFKKPHLSPQQYVADAMNSVPNSNSTTAILYVQEMEHMPAPALLKTIFRPALSGLLSWKATGQAPIACFEMIASSLRRIGLSARLLYTCSPGAWQEVASAPGGSTAAASPAPAQLPPNAGIMPIVKPTTAQAPSLVPHHTVLASTAAPTVVIQPKTQHMMSTPTPQAATGSAQLVLVPQSSGVKLGTAPLMLPTGPGTATSLSAMTCTGMPPVRPPVRLNTFGLPPGAPVVTQR